jgi:hypothetical protein
MMALIGTGYKNDTERAKQKFLDDQKANGGWLEVLDGVDNKETPFVDGEVIQALADYVTN